MTNASTDRAIWCHVCGECYPAPCSDHGQTCPACLADISRSYGPDYSRFTPLAQTVRVIS